jgi:hypothetical protein
MLNLILGIIFTGIGILILQWVAKFANEPLYNRPLIFSRPVPVLIIHILFIGFIILGLTLLWKVNYIIVIVIISIFLFLSFYGGFLNSEKQRVKRFFKIYKVLKLYRPVAPEREIIVDALTTYFRKSGWNEHRIESVLKYIVKKGVDLEKAEGIKEVANSLLLFENPSDDFSSRFNFKSYMKESSKREKAIDKAYKEMFSTKENIITRPVLSEGFKKRVLDAGFNPDEMSNEQLAALESLENTGKNHWLSRSFSFVAFVFGLNAIINLITVHLIYFFADAIIAITLMYIGYRIQARIAMKRFHEASILKYVEKQRELDKS